VKVELARVTLGSTASSVLASASERRRGCGEEGRTWRRGRKLDARCSAPLFVCKPSPIRYP
jgi:hypothetical protein